MSLFGGAITSASRDSMVMLRPPLSGMTTVTPSVSFCLPSAYETTCPNVIERALLPLSRVSYLPLPPSEVTLSSSLTGGGSGVFEWPRRNDTASTAAKITTNAAIASRRVFCQRTVWLLLYVAQALEIGDGKLE